MKSWQSWLKGAIFSLQLFSATGLLLSNSPIDQGCGNHSDCPTGEICEDLKCVDPCLGVCGLNTVCVVEDLRPLCLCKPGYKGHPFTECTLQTDLECSQNLQCPSDKACVNHRCVDPCQEYCGVNAECRVVHHRPVCACKDGFFYNPEAGCQPVSTPDCLTHSHCPEHLFCRNQTCVDPCGGVCGNNTVCSVKQHHPACACRPGFSGDAFAGCEPQEKCQVMRDAKEVGDAKDMGDVKKIGDAKEVGDAKEMGDAKEIGDAKEMGDAKKIEDAKEILPGKVYHWRDWFLYLDQHFLHVWSDSSAIEFAIRSNGWFRFILDGKVATIYSSGTTEVTPHGFRSLRDFKRDLQRARAEVKPNSPSQPILSRPGPMGIKVGNWVLASVKEGEIVMHNAERSQQATIIREDLPGFIFESIRGTKHSFASEISLGPEFAGLK